MRTKALKIVPVIFLLGLVYLAGPSPDSPEFVTDLPGISSELSALEKEIELREKKTQGLKPDNEARIIWADSSKRAKTSFSLVYLHGFSASQEEGNPVHRNFAKRYGCNLFLARLVGHGINGTDAMLDATPENLLKSANKAVAIGKQLGHKVILMSTSTGSTLSLYVAAHNPEIAGLILFSPNIDLYDKSSFLLTKPWGLQIARGILGGDYIEFPGDENSKKYWTTKYRVEALVSLKNLLNSTMTDETFTKVKQPVFMGYYYKDEENQDKTVSVERMLEMYEQLGTPGQLKRKTAFPAAGHHCLGNRFKSKDIGGVERETYKFAEEVLQLSVNSKQ